MQRVSVVMLKINISLVKSVSYHSEMPFGTKKKHTQKKNKTLREHSISLFMIFYYLCVSVSATRTVHMPASPLFHDESRMDDDEKS
jgi:hypothetical protein